MSLWKVDRIPTIVLLVGHHDLDGKVGAGTGEDETVLVWCPCNGIHGGLVLVFVEFGPLLLIL